MHALPAQPQSPPAAARRFHIATSDLIIRIAVSVVLGGLIGLERELRDQPAGLRTHLLVCLGSTVFTLTSIHGFDGLIASSPLPLTSDPARIAAQVVVGVGFLGAGAIIRQGVSVHGLTTAASLWTMAALGMVVGLGWFVLAAIVTLAVAVSLVALRLLEEKLINPRAQERSIVHVVLPPEDESALDGLINALDQLGVSVQDMEASVGTEESGGVTMNVRLPAGLTKARLVQELTRLEGVHTAAAR
ncbi:MAG: MgtC/SapB family protein [Gaiellales bacterium]|nr:MgtC/SapB family protein [Gaiellales bacterium]